MENILPIYHENAIYYDERGNIIDHKSNEREEQIDAFTFLPKNSCVLELGARYGTVSCLINKTLNNPENHVAIEPDKNVIKCLTENRDNNGCKFHIFNGAISKEPMKFMNYGYGSMTLKSDDVDSDVETIALKDLESKFKVKFDCVVADCEGCICKFVEENHIDQFKIILLEKDAACLCNYPELDEKLKSLGFLMIRNRFNIVYRSVYINMNMLPFNIHDYSVCYGSIGFFGKLGYITEYHGSPTSDVLIEENNMYPISAHAPSRIKLQTNRRLLIEGYCSPTSQIPPILTFFCDGEIIGKTNEAGQKTLPHILNPGYHILEIQPNIGDWGHSIWLIYTKD